ncbi:class II glutamine amidotransferase [Agromyces seonyuensis]|uniref:Class II glutamine amidotransferase n=1 Tax=Agromyces seonyuensis TaxID=2662446 RepID=A0A6I4NZU5_9MICO|nr:class II glutamine amidotransferase [Agromyces seonyuensis]MWB99808.1 class II glutamine amidotransferase [Agromyces seonyuensis]
MCRWLAYRGGALHPSLLVLDPAHSLVRQSLNSPLGAETVNGDGFGLGWYPIGGDAVGTPALFHSIEPAWHDENLREISRAIHSRLFFAHVRAAAGPPIQQTNCHPFRHGHWLFMHNGRIGGWRHVRRELMLRVDPEFFPLIRGTTDSEVLFHLALTFGLAQDPVAAMRRAVEFIEETGRAHGVAEPFQGTIAVSDGERIWAFRHSSLGTSRTLYVSADLTALREQYPDAERLHAFDPTARVIVSEPLNDLPGAFVEMPESTVGILGPDGYRDEPFLRAAA